MASASHDHNCILLEAGVPAGLFWNELPPVSQGRMRRSIVAAGCWGPGPSLLHVAGAGGAATRVCSCPGCPGGRLHAPARRPHGHAAASERHCCPARSHAVLQLPIFSSFHYPPPLTPDT